METIDECVLQAFMKMNTALPLKCCWKRHPKA